MKKPIISLTLLAAALSITSISAQADDTNWYVGGGVYESDSELNSSTGEASDENVSGTLIELGYNGEIFGSNLYGSKLDNTTEVFGEYIIGAEIDAGWKFHLGNSFTIKPYAMLGAQKSEDTDYYDGKVAMKVGAGVMTTWKMLYIDLEMATLSTDLEDNSGDSAELDEDVATVTFGLTF